MKKYKYQMLVAIFLSLIGILFLYMASNNLNFIQLLERTMKSFSFYLVAFFFLYLLCVISIGFSGQIDFLKPFTVIYLISIFLCYPFFELVRKSLAQMQLLERTMIDLTIVFSVLTALFLWTCFNIVFGSIIKVFFPDFFNKYKD